MVGAFVLGLIIGLPTTSFSDAAAPIACVSETGTAGLCVDGTALDGATGVVVSPDGASVYAASETSRSVSIFGRDGATGQISQLPGTHGCISENGTTGACVDGRAMVGPRGVAVSPDGRNFYFPASGSKSIAVFRREASTGELQQLDGTDGCVSETGSNGACVDGTALDGARGVAISPDGTSVYVAAFFSDAVAVFSRDPSTGTLTQLAGSAGCISETGTAGACADGIGLDGVRALAVSSDGTSVYGASELSGAVSIFRRDLTTGALTQPAGTAGCVSQSGTGGACASGRAIGGAADVVVSGDGENVYVAALASDAVAAFARDTMTGALSQLSAQAGCVSETGTNGTCVNGTALDRARSLVVTLDDANVYVGSEVSDAVSVFSRNPSTGALQQLPGTAGCVSESGGGGACADGVGLDGVRSVAVSSDGTSAYAASFWSSAVSIFVRDPATGALTQPSSTPPPPPPPPPTERTIFVSLRDATTVGGVAIANEDVVSFADTGASSMVFDGSDVGLASLRIDALDRLDEDSLLLSFDQPGSVPGIAGTVDDSDVLRFDATSLGPTTSGAFGLYLDGSDVGLTTTAHDVDALEVLSDGLILLSTTGTASLPGATARDEDLLAFTPTSLGDVTLGSFALRFDGSDVGLGDAAEDTDAVAVEASGVVHLSTLDAFAVPGVSGSDEDVFAFSPTSFDPPTTAGSYASSLVFDGSAFGLTANDLFGVDVP
jgi:6-phosphogluconolactonase (cycloisomerase 2 family)